MNFSQIYWREAGWLWLIVLPLIAGIPGYYQQSKKLKGIIDSNMRDWAIVPRSNKDIVQPLLLFLAWSFLCVALAGPRTAAWTPPAALSDQANLMVLIDLSASMQTQDIKPSRRTAALRGMKQWLEKQPPDLNIGIQLFAGNSHTVAVPTHDTETLTFLIRQIESLQLPTLGNNLAAAISDSSRLFAPHAEKRLLLLSDGDMGDRAQIQALDAAKSQGIPLYVVGLGGGEVSPVPDFKGDLLRSNGRNVLSRQQSSWLKKLALENQGSYFSLEKFLEQDPHKSLRLNHPTIQPEQRDSTLWNEYFAFPLIAALGLLFFSLRLERKLQALLLIFISFFPLLPEQRALADKTFSNLDSAYHHLRNREYARAEKTYALSPGYAARFGEGVACYRQKKFSCAIRNFSQAAWQAEDRNKRAQAVFNLANAHFRNADFSQASVLFADARALGIEPGMAQLGKDYADSALAALRRYQRDILDSLERAEWRASAFSTPENDGDEQAHDISLPSPAMTGAAAALPFTQQQALLLRALNRLNNKNSNEDSFVRWIKTRDKDAGSTSQLLQKLFELELGIPAHQEAPRALPGVRQW